MSRSITWLGQGGFLLGNNGFRLVIDPYFSNAVEQKSGLRRLIPPPFALSDLRPDVLVCTHDHLDHYDPDTVRQLLSTFPVCPLAGPSSVLRHARTDGNPADRLRPLDSGLQMTAGPWWITAMPAQHSDPEAIGLILTDGTGTIYCSGDTEYFTELPEYVRKAASGPLDLLLICINGKYGNMDWHQAVAVAEVLRPRLTIPMHYGMFQENTVDPDDFLQTCTQRSIPTRQLTLGAPLTF